MVRTGIGNTPEFARGGRGEGQVCKERGVDYQPLKMAKLRRL
jgi:hypothetical protein